jgi:hypothetical protein
VGAEGGRQRESEGGVRGHWGDGNGREEGGRGAATRHKGVAKEHGEHMVFRRGRRKEEI